MTGWQDDWMGASDDWMAFNLKVHQKLGALETTARVTRIHATDGASGWPPLGEAEPRARRGPLRSRTAGARGKESNTSCKAASCHGPRRSAMHSVAVTVHRDDPHLRGTHYWDSRLNTSRTVVVFAQHVDFFLP